MSGAKCNICLMASISSSELVPVCQPGAESGGGEKILQAFNGQATQAADLTAVLVCGGSAPQVMQPGAHEHVQ